MWFEETHTDLYDTKVQNYKFALFAKMDEKAGETEFTLIRIIMQGSVFGPIKWGLLHQEKGQIKAAIGNEIVYLSYRNHLNINNLKTILSYLELSRAI